MYVWNKCKKNIVDPVFLKLSLENIHEAHRLLGSLAWHKVGD